MFGLVLNTKASENTSYGIDKENNAEFGACGWKNFGETEENFGEEIYVFSNTQ